MNVSELRQKSVEDLGKELDNLLREQFTLRMQKGSGQLSRPDQVKKVRRSIAQIKTLINEKSRSGDAA